MAIYRFSFDPRYVGHTATVTDHAGVEVAGSPVTLDSDGDASLALTPGAGGYRARVNNSVDGFGDGYSAVDGVFDIEASIAAAGGGGGGLSADATVLWADASGSLIPDSPQWPVPWNLFEDGVSLDGDGSILLATPGLYAVYFYVEFLDPAQSTLAVAKVLAQAGGEIDASAWLQPGFGTQSVTGAGVLRLDAGAATAFNVTLSTGGATDPETPTIDDIYIQFVKLIDAA